jgi:CheY-like chemotaxis protein
MTEQVQKRILIVDDEPDVLTYLTAFLEDNGYWVDTAVNGKEGFERAKSNSPDLIALDINMPEETGVRMFRNLQEDEATAHIPVIIVTGISSDFKRFIETRRQVHAPAGNFEKPIDRGKLLQKIAEILSKKPL